VRGFKNKIKMKQLILFISISIYYYTYAQQIENINYFLEGKNIVITYDFVNCNSSELYDISVVFVEQNQSRVTPVTLSGDVQNVSCGSKRIVWNLLNDREELSGKYQVWLDFKVASKNPIDIEWVQIPSGTFLMGSPLSEINRSDDEIQHQVTLSAFKMSKNEITFAQYELFCEKTGRQKTYDNGWGRGTRPVINVSWEDATAFAKWMGCRLPTEAEWEYACRAGKTTPFNTGVNLTTNQANYNGNYPYNINPKGNDLQKTMPVGSYSPNSWGLNDMHGNVWEWCSDWYGNYQSSSQTNPTGASSGSDRVYRGGSWSLNAQYCRSADRGGNVPSDRNSYLGFRLVVAP
jgi:formylglycine-generating enzyme required for sulfatase activity